MKKALVALVVLLAPFVVLAQLDDPQVAFTGGLEVGGMIDAKSGIRFPDGTVQLSAANGSAPDLTANAGLYDNRIVEFSPVRPYVEVCFKHREVEFDIHVNGRDSTAGGDCVPGDVGWVIEREERVALFWEDARAECLLNGMRLPEPFEFMFSCRRDAQLGLLDMTGNSEWASNEAQPTLGTSRPGLAAALIGTSGCDNGAWEWVGANPASSAARTYRCVR